MKEERSFLYYIFQFLSKMPLTLLQAFAFVVACFFCHLTQAKTLRNSQLNLKIALPHLSEADLKRLHKQASINEIKSYFEFISIWGSSTQKNIARVHQIYGEQLFHDALAKQKGVVLIVPHFGTWEIMNAWLSQYTTLTIMYKPNKNISADGFVKKARSREHAHLVPTNETGVKEIFKALKKGGATAILPDHSPDQSINLTPWFGVPLYSSHLSAKLIQKTKATALLLYAIRNAQNGFDMHITNIDDKIYDPAQGTLILHHTLETLIRQYPEHYHWSYKRFQASPETAGLYDQPQHEALEKIRKLQNVA